MKSIIKKIKEDIKNANIIFIILLFNNFYIFSTYFIKIKKQFNCNSIFYMDSLTLGIPENIHFMSPANDAISIKIKNKLVISKYIIFFKKLLFLNHKEIFKYRKDLYKINNIIMKINFLDIKNEIKNINKKITKFLIKPKCQLLKKPAFNPP